MGKTNFINGSYLTPTFANAIFAHVHDGVDADGHVAKVNLSTEVAGALPLANMTKIPLSGADIGVTGLLTTRQTTGMDFVDQHSAQGITGAKTFNSGASFGSTGINLSGAGGDLLWTPITIGTLPASAYLRGWKCINGTAAAGGGEYFYVGQMLSSTAASGGILYSAFGWPNFVTATWDITAVDSTGAMWRLKTTTVISTAFPTSGKYQAIAQPNAAGTAYQTGLTTNYLALEDDGDTIYFWFKTAGAGDRTVKFTMHVRVCGYTF